MLLTVSLFQICNQETCLSEKSPISLVKEKFWTFVMSTDYLKQYQSGDYAIWDELVSSASRMLDSPEYQKQLVSIAEEIMLRVKRNVDCLRANLVSCGAEIGPKGEPSSVEDILLLKKNFGAIPLALDVFYQKIGSIDITPKSNYDYGKVSLEKLDGVSLIALDPLQIFSAADLRWSFEEPQEDNSFQIYLCPDFLHKQNLSGGLPCSIHLPAETREEMIDPIIQGEKHSLTFVNYLRHNFKWAGFPGLEIVEKTDQEISANWKLGFKKVRGDWRLAYRRLLIELQHGLIEF